LWNENNRISTAAINKFNGMVNSGERKTNSMELIRGDIAKVEADAIVNAANSSLMGGGGVDGAIHRAGGKAILEEYRKIIAKQGPCKTGEAVITTAGNLPARFVIHTVGPVWNNGQKNEAHLLANCYKNSLGLAMENHCVSVAFPCISTGIYRYPIDQAAQIAVKVVRAFLAEHNEIEKALFVCYDDENYRAIQKRLELTT
jgi:O-acetyl-ADP-ribose deacetylase (regulator of RNase III)